MLKFLLITFLIGYLFFKVIGMLFKFVLRGTSTSNQEQFRSNNTGNSRKKPSDGNVNIDYMPKNDKKSKDGFKGGEYVDYEEIK